MNEQSAKPPVVDWTITECKTSDEPRHPIDVFVDAEYAAVEAPEVPKKHGLTDRELQAMHNLSTALRDLLDMWETRGMNSALVYEAQLLRGQLFAKIKEVHESAAA